MWQNLNSTGHLCGVAASDCVMITGRQVLSGGNPNVDPANETSKLIDQIHKEILLPAKEV